MKASTHSGLNFAPWRLSGTVYGTLLNDPAALAAIGEAANHAPYKAAPRSPVLYVKPRNTLAGHGSHIAVPTGTPALEIGASLGIVIGRATCRVRAQDAFSHIAGWTLVADLSVPHDSFYRPSVRLKALDGSCLLGPRVVQASQVPDPDALTLVVSTSGNGVHTFSTGGMQRGVAQLLQDVSAFMTLSAGDVLMLGVKFGAPQAKAGDSFSVDCAPIGMLQGQLVSETVEVAA
ncbi:MAG TPA: fumarylacetoacetate hydrolase family protein [Burkholderiaceae bacterium]|nr:fumarylacetoacetate hydrolase family protein [Burkholderiaceae bacterium]HRA62703.1 fumarylacetoacetate hydrolase family protein [Burkholderiaceae bacterium]